MIWWEGGRCLCCPVVLKPADLALTESCGVFTKGSTPTERKYNVNTNLLATENFLWWEQETVALNCDANLQPSKLSSAHLLEHSIAPLNSTFQRQKRFRAHDIFLHLGLEECVWNICSLSLYQTLNFSVLVRFIWHNKEGMGIRIFKWWGKDYR